MEGAISPRRPEWKSSLTPWGFGIALQMCQAKTIRRAYQTPKRPKHISYWTSPIILPTRSTTVPPRMTCGKKLRSFTRPRTRIQKLHLSNNWCNWSWQKRGVAINHLGRFRAVQDELASIGEATDQTFLCALILMSLPPSWVTIKQLVTDKEMENFENLAQRLIREYERNQQYTSNNNILIIFLQSDPLLQPQRHTTGVYDSVTIGVTRLHPSNCTDIAPPYCCRTLSLFTLYAPVQSIPSMIGALTQLISNPSPYDRVWWTLFSRNW